MREPKRYYCGNGEGMFEDDKNGHWVEYSEHKAVVDALTEQLRKHGVVGQSEQLKALLEKLLENNMCSHAGDELIEEALKGF